MTYENIPQIEFGWLPERVSFSTNLVEIEPLETYDEAIQEVMDYEGTGNFWIYPPYANSQNEKCIKPQTEFVLPSTHQIRSHCDDFCNTTCINFFISLLGYCRGLCLIPSTGRYLYRTAVSIGHLTGFFADKKDVKSFLFCLDKFLINHAEPDVKKLNRIVVTFLMGQVFETFDTKFFYQYAVLDALYALANPAKRDKHASRIKVLADRFDLKLPSWAISSNNTSSLSLLRNFFFHEASFDPSHINLSNDKPGRIVNELTDFNSRLIAAILGYDGEFAKSSSQTRQMYGFKGHYNPSLAL